MARKTMILSGKEVAGYCSSYTKINPNGVDLAPKQVMQLPGDATIYLRGEKRGYLDETSGRVVEKKRPVVPNGDGFYVFDKRGLYELRFPRVRVPATCMGLAFPRSTFNRLGIIKLESAVFDSGYEGEPTQTIFTPLKAIVHKDEAFIQLVFMKNDKRARTLYRGHYQNEKAKV
jgi:deoxycytidine triphosphate deaminase